MRNKYIDAIEQTKLKKETPRFEIGDEVIVGVKIIEGNKERVQPFQGTVIARRGKGPNETFTVRRIVQNEGVERIFPVQSPRIAGVEVVRHGKVRRAKLYYLRERVGKSRKLRERRVTGAESGEAPPESAADRPAPKSTRRAAAPRQEAVATV
jgi:large subunit ribosomal protein L19